MTDLLMMGGVIAVQIAADTDWNTVLQKEKRTLRECAFSFGRGIRIRTLNNGVRVRCVTVTLYLYIMICTINAFTIITYKNNLSSFILKF